MPNKLIGTHPNQVPANADLGSAAFVDTKEFLLSKGSNLSAINSVISETAYDIFLYDTTKDSDSGAWRKRTKNTSWYKEELNTEIRGSRREFPSIAIIVIDASFSMKIYDGDDPNLPLWMTGNRWGQSGGSDQTVTFNYKMFGPYEISSVWMLNGIMSLGTYRSAGEIANIVKGVTTIDFVKDASFMSTDEGKFRRLVPISKREEKTAYEKISTATLGTGQVHDVCMTVLPSAPVDVETNMPVPTIASAHNGGISIIRDDETVVDIQSSHSSYTYSREVKFLENNDLLFTMGDAGGGLDYVHTMDGIPTADTTITIDQKAGTGQDIRSMYRAAMTTSTAFDNLLAIGRSSNLVRSLTPKRGRAFATGAADGLTNLVEDVDSNRGEYNYITDRYNTGWLIGNTRLSAMTSNNYETLGDNLVRNGTFATDSEWIKGTDWTISGGVANIADNNRTSDSFLVQGDIPLIPGEAYSVTWTQNISVGDMDIDLNGDKIWGVTLAYGNGTNTITWIAGVGLTNTIRFVANQHCVGTIDNVIVRKADANRSYYGAYEGGGKNTQLVPVGRVKKKQVASGAELASYGPFSTTNFLYQPYTSSLQFGTGEMMFACWFKTTSTTLEQTIMRRFGTAVTGGYLMRLLGSSSELQWFVRTTSSNNYVVATSGAPVDDGKWHMAVGARAGSKIRLYLDGNLVGTNTSIPGGASIDDTSNDAITYFGIENGLVGPVNAYPGEMALVRFASAEPTAQQVKRWYETEKHLFSENSNACLYGSSHNIIDTAFDSGTDMLHVGTSSGVSVFKDLARVDHSENGITKRIWASNEYVIEE